MRIIIQRRKSRCRWYFKLLVLFWLNLFIRQKQLI